MRNIIFEKNDIKKSVALCVALLAVLLRLGLSYTQFATIYPPLAPIDDDLMTRAAMSIVSGEWLGEYTYLTISKHAFFAVWLAFLHNLGIPYLPGNMALWILACFTMIMAVSPRINLRWQRLLIFLALVYNPAACRQYSTRIYRDAIFPSLCLIFFSGIIGVGLRYKERIKSWIVFMLMYGTSFGCIYLCREDGIWVLPFSAVAIIIVIILLVIEKKASIKKCIALLAPFVLSVFIIGMYAYQNYTHYGRFIVSDFTSKDFKSAYGAMTSLSQDNWDSMVCVPSDVREDLYDNIEMFYPVKEALTEPLLMEGYYSTDRKDFTSGSFYWALRRALSTMGVYESANSAKEYYESLTDQIQALVDNGILTTQNGSRKLRVSVTPPVKIEYVPAVLSETINGFSCVIFFDQCDPLAERAVGTDEEISEVENFIGQRANKAYVTGTDIPYISTSRNLAHNFIRLIRSIYSIFTPIFLIISVVWQFKQLFNDITEKRLTDDGLLNIILFGVIGMALFRCRMIAFVEVSSFGIGTYVMYLSTVHPLIILYSLTGFCKTFEN